MKVFQEISEKVLGVSPIQVSFGPRRNVLQHLGAGVYAYPKLCPCGVLADPTAAKCPSCSEKLHENRFYARPSVNGRQTMRRLTSSTLRNAQLEVAQGRIDQRLARLGRGSDPYARDDKATVGHVLDFYLAAGCPKKNGTERTGKQLSEEKRCLENLRRHLGARAWGGLTLEDLHDYHAARVKEVGGRRGPGHRTVDIEERVLSSAFRWAARHSRKSGVNRNPVAHDRPQHTRPEHVRHCREVMPANADELHRLAKALFAYPRGEVLGWQLLFEAMIGQRTSEILKLRMDAKAAFEPGYVKGDLLYLHRSKTAKGTFPYVKVGSELRKVLAAHRRWHAERFPESPWYFPSSIKEGAEAVKPDALTHALRRLTVELKMPRVTSHGLRSYFVNVLRSQGKTDAEIALRIGHKTGGTLIVRVYGEILPYKLGWKPEKEKAAWERF